MASFPLELDLRCVQGKASLREKCSFLKPVSKLKVGRSLLEGWEHSCCRARMADTKNPESAAAATRVGAPQARGEGPPPCTTHDCCQRQGPGPGRSLQVARLTSVSPSSENATQDAGRHSHVSQEPVTVPLGIAAEQKSWDVLSCPYFLHKHSQASDDNR